MLTIDEILRAYDDGVLTTNELCGHLVQLLATVPSETVRERLRTEAGRLEAFEAWVDDVAAGAEIFAGSRPVHISADDRAGIARFQAHARAVRYAELARGSG